MQEQHEQWRKRQRGDDYEYDEDDYDEDDYDEDDYDEDDEYDPPFDDGYDPSLDRPCSLDSQAAALARPHPLLDKTYNTRSDATHAIKLHEWETNRAVMKTPKSASGAALSGGDWASWACKAPRNCTVKYVVHFRSGLWCIDVAEGKHLNCSRIKRAPLSVRNLLKLPAVAAQLMTQKNPVLNNVTGDAVRGAGAAHGVRLRPHTVCRLKRENTVALHKANVDSYVQLVFYCREVVRKNPNTVIVLRVSTDRPSPTVLAGVHEVTFSSDPNGFLVESGTLPPDDDDHPIITLRSCTIIPHQSAKLLASASNQIELDYARLIRNEDAEEGDNSCMSMGLLSFEVAGKDVPGLATIQDGHECLEHWHDMIRTIKLHLPLLRNRQTVTVTDRPLKTVRQTLHAELLAFPRSCLKHVERNVRTAVGGKKLDACMAEWNKYMHGAETDFDSERIAWEALKKKEPKVAKYLLESEKNQRVYTDDEHERDLSLERPFSAYALLEHCRNTGAVVSHYKDGTNVRTTNNGVERLNGQMKVSCLGVPGFFRRTSTNSGPFALLVNDHRVTALGFLQQQGSLKQWFGSYLRRCKTSWTT